MTDLTTTTERVLDNTGEFETPTCVVEEGDMEQCSDDRDSEKGGEEEEDEEEMFYKEHNTCTTTASAEDCETSHELKESKETSSDSKRDGNSDPDVKPTHSYIALIAMAILSCPNKKMILGDIYQYISDNFPYYRNKDKSWRNSIRHNLSLNECFIKAGRSENGKGNYWAIHPANLEDFANGDFRRRRARRRVRRSNPLKFGSASSQSAYLRGLSSLSSSHTSFIPYRADDYRMYPSLAYIPPTKKSFAIDSLIGSYDSSFFYSPASVRSYPSMGLHNGLDYTLSTGTPSHSLLYHSSPALSSYLSTEVGPSNIGYTTSTDSSAFSAYLGSKAALTRISSRHESWQDTLSKLQEQLRKGTP